MSRYKQVYGWTDGSRVFLSVMPQNSNGAVNAYDTPGDAMRDAQVRKMVIRWADQTAIDKLMSRKA